jgi:hypothetical protein
MAELRIHDQSSIYFKSIRTGTTTKDIDVKIPDKSGTLITDTTLQDILNRGGRFSASQILKPDITETPLEHPEAYSKLLPIASYRTSDTFVGEHTATEWVASEQPDFSIILDSTSDSLFRDGWYPAVNRPSVPVYVKYRFISEDVCSPYSDALEFTTPTGGVKIPTLSVVEDGVTPTVKGSPFALYGDATGINHVSSSWEIYRVRDNKLIKSITQDSSKLTEYKIEAGLLDSDTEYKFVLTYHTDHPVFSRTRKALGIYKTPESSIKTPTLSFNSDNNKYLIIGTPFVVNSGTDEHKFTAWEVKNATDAVVYTEPNSRDLTTLNLTGVLEPDSSYTVTAVYKGAKASSAKAVLTFRTPVETIDNLNKKITLTRLANGVMELKMDKVQLATAEKLLYLTWTVQNYEKKVALEVRLDKDLDTKYGQDLIYTMTPAESWLKWFPNLDAVNPTLKLSAKGRVVGEKTILNYSTSAPFEYKPKIELGEMSVAGHTESLTPLVSITAHSGEDLSWITVTNATWELWKLQEGLNPIKVKSVDSSDLLKNRYNGLDYNTNYRATVVYNTNFGKYSKSIEFKSADIFLPRPNVIVESKGNTILIKVNNPDRTIPGKPEKSHGSTTWILYSNTGDTLWKSEKNTTNLTEITLPTGLLQGTTNYKVGVIFHSRDGLLSSSEGQASYYHRGIEIVEGSVISDIGLQVLGNTTNTSLTMVDWSVSEGGVKSATEQITSAVWTPVSGRVLEVDKKYENNLVQKTYTGYPTISLVDTYYKGTFDIAVRTTSGIEKTIRINLEDFNTPLLSRINATFYHRGWLSSGALGTASRLNTKTNNKYLYLGYYKYKTVSDKTEYDNLPSYDLTMNDMKIYISVNTYNDPNKLIRPRGNTNELKFGIPSGNTTEAAGSGVSFYDNMNRIVVNYRNDNTTLTDYNSISEQIIYNSYGHHNHNFGYLPNNITEVITPTNLIQNKPSLTSSVSMISPNTYEVGFFCIEYDLSDKSFEIANLDKYVYYFNNMHGLDYSYNGYSINLRFPTKDEVLLFLRPYKGTEFGNIGEIDEGDFQNFMKTVDADIYYIQENIDINQNVKTIHIKNKTGKGIKDPGFDLEITEGTNRILNTKFWFVMSIRSYAATQNTNISKFKSLYPKLMLIEAFSKIVNTTKEFFPYVTSDDGSKVWKVDPIYAINRYSSNGYNPSIITSKYSWLTVSGYITTLSNTLFKPLSEIRTLLGLNPTNVDIAESELIEWYVLYWRGRVYFIPNIPIASIKDNIGNKWKYLYNINSDGTIPAIKLLQNNDTEFKLVMPQYTDLTDFNSVPDTKKFSDVKMLKYAKLNRLGAIGDELGDMINPALKGLSHSYDDELYTKFSALYSKLSSTKYLPFFEAIPTVKVHKELYTGCIYIMDYPSGGSAGDYNIGIRVHFKKFNMLHIDTREHPEIKIDKVIIKLYGESLENNEVVLETVEIKYDIPHGQAYTRSDYAFDMVLYLVPGQGENSPFTGFDAYANNKATAPLNWYPKNKEGVRDRSAFNKLTKMEYYIHINYPEDCFIYGTCDIRNKYTKHFSLLREPTNFFGEVFYFNTFRKVLRENELTEPTIKTDDTRKYYSISDPYITSTTGETAERRNIGNINARMNYANLLRI